MTCAHVLGLIDAGPFAEYPRRQLDAAWQHARECPTCGPARAAAAALAEGLSAMAHPAPPRELATAVMARIARLEPVSYTAATPVRQVAREAGDWSGWAVGLGSAVGMAAVISLTAGNAALLNFSPAIGSGTTSLVAMPTTVGGTSLFAAGLILYALGLFAPLRGTHRE